MGYGDDLMVTGEVKELLKTRPKAKFIIGDGKKSFWSEIYLNNHSIISAKEINDYEEIIWINNYPHNRPYRIYDKKTNHIQYTWRKSYRVKQGQIFFSEEEISFAKNVYEQIKKKSLNKKIIYIEPNIKLTKGYLNRDWGFNKWQKVVNTLKNDYVFFQVSYGNQKILKNAINLHNVNFRNACALLAKSDLYIGGHGGLSHAAAALNKKSVVIFGGWIDPLIVGYSFHTNLFIKNNESPCGAKNTCKHCIKCMELITVKMVTKEIKKLF